MKSLTSNKIARLISTLFIPPTFTILFFALFVFSIETESQKTLVTTFVALILGFKSPITLFLFLRKKGKMIDVDASIKEE